jgi:hypothetical protein
MKKETGNECVSSEVITAAVVHCGLRQEVYRILWYVFDRNHSIITENTAKDVP